MSKIHFLIWLSYTFLFLAGIGGLLLSVSFTRGQRKRFPFLKKLDGKQIHLCMPSVVFFSYWDIGLAFTQRLPHWIDHLSKLWSRNLAS